MTQILNLSRNTSMGFEDIWKMPYHIFISLSEILYKQIEEENKQMKGEGSGSPDIQKMMSSISSNMPDYSKISGMAPDLSSFKL